MKNSTPFLPSFGPLLFGRRPKSEQAKALEKLKLSNTLGDLKAVCADSIPDKLLSPAAQGAHSRQRIYSLPVIFWAFLAQVLSPGTSCREIVRRIQAWHAAAESETDSSPQTVAYCKARAKLPDETLTAISHHIAQRCERNTPDHALWKGRTVKIIDGTTVSMPDTPLNQETYPQPTSQKPGCGFPLLRLVGLFSLASGALLQWAKDSTHIHESLLFRRLWDFLEKNDILLADRGFCSYFAISELKNRGVDSVIRLHQRRKFDITKGKKLGPNDQLQTWTKPATPPTGLSQDEFASLPDTLTVRVVKIQFAAKGFRTTSCLIATTLLDAKLYTLESLGELYYQRWTIELHFRELKTLLGMEILRCRSPHMITRELHMHFIAYNVIRHVMQSAALRNHTPLSRISFKGSLDTLRHWAPILDAARKSPPQTTPPPSGNAPPHRQGPTPPTPRPIRTPSQKTPPQKLPTPHQAPQIHGPCPQKKPPLQNPTPKSQIRLKLAPFMPDPYHASDHGKVPAIATSSRIGFSSIVWNRIACFSSEQVATAIFSKNNRDLPMLIGCHRAKIARKRTLIPSFPVHRIACRKGYGYAWAFAYEQDSFNSGKMSIINA